MDKKRILGILALCLVTAVAVLGMWQVLHAPRPEFSGSRIRGDEEFMLDMTEMNGEQTHTLKLEKDDVLQCRWIIERGNVSVLIVGEDGDKLYRGDQIDQAEFILIADKTGDYRITVTGDQARGFIDIRKDTKKTK